MERIKKIIQEEIMKIISARLIKDPRVPEFLTITKLTISKDLHYAHIYFTTFGNDSEKKHTAIKGLNSACGFIQKIIAEKINLKYTPKLEFRYDEEEAQAYKVDKILDTLSKERLLNENNQDK